MAHLLAASAPDQVEGRTRGAPHEVLYFIFPRSSATTSATQTQGGMKQTRDVTRDARQPKVTGMLPFDACIDVTYHTQPRST
eukprot:349585-Chlamydomonas_euryale.AAC.3